MTTRDPSSSSSPSMPRDDRLSRLRALIAQWRASADDLRKATRSWMSTEHHNALLSKALCICRQADELEALLLSGGDQRQGQDQQKDEHKRRGVANGHEG